MMHEGGGGLDYFYALAEIFWWFRRRCWDREHKHE